MYRIADKKGQLIKHPFLCFIKAISPLRNYDDKPSIPLSCTLHKKEK
ncbi:hypothetical protein HMPREF0381_1508 [Lachnoanaerobaculum saburreum DSM 3986]|uniref:Uncharacterized protein n=1 Tax=Lachnoanaerobaculum saburreum DSM 3986 TaxID=887325 RepID=E6LNH3_9FIRM|nr:hypothetical protein HMPREF0381_1508 [Lachnoanaerobaculum saburreum DSM 3986]